MPHLPDLIWRPEYSSEPGFSPMLVGLVVIAAYALGCFSSGYYLVRLRTGADLRDSGSRSTGATNAGRLLGKYAFLLTLLLDALKSVAALLLARAAGLPPWACWLTVLAVVAGHVWPIQLRFRGGKGIVPFLASLLVLQPRLLLLQLALFAVALVPLRRVTLAGLAAITASPIALLILGVPLPQLWGLAAAIALLLWAHRDNLQPNRPLPASTP